MVDLNNPRSRKAKALAGIPPDLQPKQGPFSLRVAIPDDRAELVEVYEAAFADSVVDRLVYPPRSTPEPGPKPCPAVDDALGDEANPIVVALHEGSIVGWVKWTRKPNGVTERRIVRPADFPPEGNQIFGAAFFQACADAPYDLFGVEPHYHLGLLVVRPSAQRKGVGSVLIQYGLAKLDKEDGWRAFVNASEQGRPLYERFGFKVGQTSVIPGEPSVTLYHMARWFQ